MLPDWVRGYERSFLRFDVIAGLTAAAVVIPKAMAYATIAGLPVEAGLYTAFVPMVAYALLGTSRQLSVSTTTTIAILTAAAVQALPAASGGAMAGVSAALTVLVGAALVLAGVMRLGFLGSFISEPVLVGFKAGIGLVIVLDQLPKLLGIHFAKGSFFHNLDALAAGLPDTSLPTVAVGAATVVALLLMEHALPRLPAPLLAVAAGIVAVDVFGLRSHGIATIGAVPTGLPPVTPPDLGALGALWPAALGIALISFTETIAAGRAFARPGEPIPQANRELAATGLANVAGAFLGSMPAGGGTTQTAVNRLAGARTQLAGLVTAGATLATMLLLAPFIGSMPEATLAAVVIVYSVGLIQPAEFRAILSVRRTEFAWALVALAGVVVLGTLQGIVAAIVVSLLALAYQLADPPVHELRRKPGTTVFRPRSADHPDDESFPGLLLVRPEGRIFFANAARTGEKLRALIAASKPRVIALDLGGVFDLEYTALKMLAQAEQELRAAGVTVWLVGLNPSVLAMVRSAPLGKTLGNERLIFNLDQAVERFTARSD